MGDTNHLLNGMILQVGVKYMTLVKPKPMDVYKAITGVTSFYPYL